MHPRSGHAGTGALLGDLPAGRLASIDVVRGFAILWVLAYHLWTDLRFPNVYPDQSDAFREVPRQLADADIPGAIAAAIEAFLRVGYLGVPLFMMLSGVSLTLTALRRESTPSRQWGELPTPDAAAHDCRTGPGFAITVAFAAALAFVQWQRHGGAPYIDYLRNGDINLHTDQLVAGLLLVPRMFRNEWQFAPEGSLWFVIVVVQYYLLFPLLFAALRRVGRTDDRNHHAGHHRRVDDDHDRRRWRPARVQELGRNRIAIPDLRVRSRHRDRIHACEPFRRLVDRHEPGWSVGSVVRWGSGVRRWLLRPARCRVRDRPAMAADHRRPRADLHARARDAWRLHGGAAGPRARLGGSDVVRAPHRQRADAVDHAHHAGRGRV